MKPDVAEDGPFLVPRDDIELAGFDCKLCKEPVRVAKRIVKYRVSRSCAYACGCGPAVIVMEDQPQPSQRNWHRTIKVARKNRVDVVVFGTDKPTSLRFSGLN
jgi:hypothetical protein